MQTLSLNSRFNLTFVVKKSDTTKISKMLTDNNWVFSQYYKNGYSSFVEYSVECNLKRAEAVRQMLKNIKTYE